MEIHDKKQLAAICIERLKKEYPLSDCTLDYEHAWQLLVEVRLAAQCTDARVNVVVQDLFAKYRMWPLWPPRSRRKLKRSCGPADWGAARRGISAPVCGCCATSMTATCPMILTPAGTARRGRKSANLIMGDVFGKPAIVTDTHCIRLCNRIGLVDNIKEPKKVEMALWKIIPPQEAVISATGWWTMAAPCAPHAPHRIVSAAACGMCAAMRMKKAKRTEPRNAPHHTTPFICLLFYKTLGFWLWGML